MRESSSRDELRDVSSKQLLFKVKAPYYKLMTFLLPVLSFSVRKSHGEVMETNVFEKPTLVVLSLLYLNTYY